ncbi:MAG: MoaD/ThiS family protein [Candidatus Omnitrophota bacterium]|nr:MoaD/ThiS family protein [Candidatus Omnitrophota bacterium]
MIIKVRIPTPLQKLTKDKDLVECSAGTVKELVGALEKEYPGIKDRLCDENGKIRRFLNIYVNDEDIRFLEMDKTPLKDGDEVSIIPAIAGGNFSASTLLAMRPGGFA